MTPTEEAATILIRTFEALARRSGATLNARTREDLRRACELLAQGDGLEELLDDLPTPARQSPAEHAIADPDYQRWRARRAVE